MDVPLAAAIFLPSTDQWTIAEVRVPEGESHLRRPCWNRWKMELASNIAHSVGQVSEDVYFLDFPLPYISVFDEAEAMPRRDVETVQSLEKLGPAPTSPILRTPYGVTPSIICRLSNSTLSSTPPQKNMVSGTASRILLTTTNIPELRLRSVHQRSARGVLSLHQIRCSARQRKTDE